MRLFPMIETILALMLHLWWLILLPMLPLAIIRRAGRIVFFLIGVLFFLAVTLSMGPQGPHSLTPYIPFLGLALSLACVLAELPAFFIHRMRKRRSNSQGPL
jgi:hypothetical protein